MNPPYPPYFLQSKHWAEFWLENMLPGHQFEEISLKQDDVEIKSFIYQYPWVGGQKFWYMPKAPIVNTNKESYKHKINRVFYNFMDKVCQKAAHQNITYIKIDFDTVFTDLVGIQNNEELKKYTYYQICNDTRLSKKTIQYLSTITLDLSQITSPNQDFDVSSLKKFYDSNKSFFKTTSQRVRRYTKKSLEIDWTVDDKKTEEGFENFWQVYTQTMERQNFASHPQTYFKSLYNRPESKVIILKDNQNQPVSVWFGLVSDKTLTYLYGGNTDYSLKNHGQYIIYLAAIKMCVDQKLDFFDFGGYNPKLGFGYFKEGYKGNVRDFLGPIDILISPKKYYLTLALILITKPLRYLKKIITRS